MTPARGQAVSNPRLRVEVHVEEVGNRTSPWRQLWCRLLAPKDADASITNDKGKSRVTSSPHDHTSSFS